MKTVLTWILLVLVMGNFVQASGRETDTPKPIPLQQVNRESTEMIQITIAPDRCGVQIRQDANAVDITLLGCVLQEKQPVAVAITLSSFEMQVERGSKAATPVIEISGLQPGVWLLLAGGKEMARFEAVSQAPVKSELKWEGDKPAGLFRLERLSVKADQEQAPALEVLYPPQDEFFSKRIICCGSVPIKAHAVVADAALLEANRRIARLIGSNPVISSGLKRAGSEVHIIGKDQNTSDLPYLRHFKGQPYDGNQTIDERTRGVGGREASCGEENLLKLKNDRYYRRDICSHEFAHTILDYALPRQVRQLVQERYQQAKAEGLWPSYAGSNEHEYFAELTMWYVGTRGDLGRIEPRPEEGVEWLKKYDPKGYDLLDRIYSGRINEEMNLKEGENGPS